MVWKYTADLSDNFFKILTQNICFPWKINPLDMLGVMMSESGVHSGAENPISSATGLIQEMKPYPGGMTRDQFAGLTAEQQLPYVKNYFASYAAKGLDSPARVYQAVFLPASLALGSDPSTVIVAEHGMYGWAYEANAVFDENHDLKITVGELSDAVRRNCKGPRWTEIVMRTNGVGSPDTISDRPVAPTYDLRTVRGIQEALTKLGIDCGPIDGLPGPKTRLGVLSFQTTHTDCGSVDGIIGPKTRASMSSALLANPQTP